ncbi:MAG: Leucine-responsive regulatory protein, regulator for leucine (or lrp) regulon and high-affinity branched-chain amino acid transport system, partial [uncultured Nocardioidaceae bacterium]
GGHRPAHPVAAGRGRPDVVHRPRQGDRPLDVGSAPAGQAAGEPRGDQVLRRCARLRGGRSADHRLRLHPPHRRLAARRLPGPDRRHPRDRVLLVGGRGHVLHPQGAGRDATPSRGPAREDPRSGERLHPDDGGAVHAVRGATGRPGRRPGPL